MRTFKTEVRKMCLLHAENLPSKHHGAGILFSFDYK